MERTCCKYPPEQTRLVLERRNWGEIEVHENVVKSVVPHFVLDPKKWQIVGVSKSVMLFRVSARFSRK